MNWKSFVKKRINSSNLPQIEIPSNVKTSKLHWLTYKYCKIKSKIWPMIGRIKSILFNSYWKKTLSSIQVWEDCSMFQGRVVLIVVFPDQSVVSCKNIRFFGFFYIKWQIFRWFCRSHRWRHAPGINTSPELLLATMKKLLPIECLNDSLKLFPN